MTSTARTRATSARSQSSIRQRPWRSTPIPARSSGICRARRMMRGTVAVQFSSPPQSLLATVEGIQTVTVLTPEEGMRALAEGRADAAYLWGPSAGWLNNHTYAGRYQVVPTEGPAMSWHVAIGFRRADAALRERIQSELDGLGPWLGELAAKYGFPSGAPVRLAAMTDEPIRLAAAGAITGILAQAAAPA